MTTPDNLINHQFASAMEHIAQAASEHAETLARVADAIVHALLADGKLLACANGSANTLAQHLCTTLLNRYEHDRPALPAINLGGDATTFSAICRDNRFNETFSRQIRALGKPGDLLLVIVDDGHKSNLIQAIQAAHDRDMRVVVLSAREKTDITSLLHPEDYEIALHNLDPSQAMPLFMIMANCLSALVEQQLFGG